MKLNKSTALVAAAILLASTTFGVWAACGDSVCETIAGETRCVAETNAGLVNCTEADPCVIRCR